MGPLSDTQLDDLADRLADRVAVRLAARTSPSMSVVPSSSGCGGAAPEPEWLTAAEAAQRLGFRTMKAFYTAVERGQVPGSRLGRRLRFNRAGLDRLLSGRAGRLAARVPSLPKESERW